jgi:hypothetical protein
LFNAAHLNEGDHAKFDCGKIFTGAVVATAAENIDSIRDMPGVTNVWPLTRLSTPRSLHLNDELHDCKLSLNYSVHQWTGVDKLHQAGIKGRGVRVAIVDTGIDYSHLAVCLNLLAAIVVGCSHL